MKKHSCRICGKTDEEYWTLDRIFGILCQDCIIKYTSRLMTVAQSIVDAEINKIKEENENETN